MVVEKFRNYLKGDFQLLLWMHRISKLRAVVIHLEKVHKARQHGFYATASESFKAVEQDLVLVMTWAGNSRFILQENYTDYCKLLWRGYPFLTNVAKQTIFEISEVKLIVGGVSLP